VASATANPSKKPSATSKPPAKAKVSPVPTSAPTSLSVKVTGHTATALRNSIASVTIKTAAKARCSIAVEYKSGPSTAAGLGDKTASSSGVVTWSWKVGSNTTRGTWPIYIDCQLGSRSGSAETSFTVR
jgi:hypothetical protein